ncbi:RimJ/RimL family protein N-acetyltransferase [Streptacidiphilus sp. MAP12-33]|uniref:GNAT family N-acetyltransferase n=1 Tax=Streptacidiphilus sp. MAP12-33 TaxID=3156266 RepID=UPI003514ABF3
MAEDRQPVLRPGDVPERVLAEGLLLRRWQAGDRDARHRAILESFDHLHAWMAWADRPPTAREHAERFGRALSWPSGHSYQFAILDEPGRTILGTAAVHDSLGGEGVEIGYWCHADHVGRGVVTRSARALTRLLLGLDHVARVEIHCDEANVRSAAVARRLGYRLDRVEDDGVTAPGESGRGMVWVKER